MTTDLNQKLIEAQTRLVELEHVQTPMVIILQVLVDVLEQSEQPRPISTLVDAAKRTLTRARVLEGVER